MASDEPSKFGYPFEMTEEQLEALETMAGLRKMTVQDWLREAVRNQIESDGHFHYWAKFIKEHGDDTDR